MVATKAVTLQSQEWRTVDEQGNETFGEVLYVNGNPVNKEKYGEDATMELTMGILEALELEYEILADLEPTEMVSAQVQA